jgi:hypothetical protein
MPSYAYGHDELMVAWCLDSRIWLAVKSGLHAFMLSLVCHM